MRDTEYATKLKQMKAQARKKKREWANIGKGNRPDPVAQIVGQREEERHGRSTVGQRAKAAGTNPEYIRQADKLQAEAPELLDKVLAGEVTLPEATKMLKAAAATKEEIEQETPTAQPDGSETSGDANQEIRHAQQKVRDFRAYIKGLPETDAAYGIFKGAGAERYLGWWASDLRGTPRRTRTKGAAAEEDLAAISEQAKLWAHGRTWDERPFPKDLEGLARLRRLSEIIRWSLNQFLDRLDRKLGDAV